MEVAAAPDPDGQQPAQSTANAEASQGGVAGAAEAGAAEAGAAEAGAAEARAAEAGAAEAGAAEAEAAGFLNVPPLEAARRKETALNLLTGKGIDPATLSAEQFNIFANQAPQLQEASLEMLAKYGAEKLRIVHPDDKDQAGSATSTPASTQAPSTANTPATASVATRPAVETPTKKARRGKKKSDAANSELSIGDGAVVSLTQNGAVGTTASTLRPQQAKAKKTRGACEICKQKKLKCTKEHPACSICQGSGEQCVYAPPKPRRKSEKSMAAAEPEDSDVPESTQGPQPQPETQSSVPVQQLVEEEVHEPAPPSPAPVHEPAPPPPAPMPSQPLAPMEDPENDEFIPDPNILSAPVEHHPHPTATQQAADNYYQSHNEATFPSHHSNPERNLISGLTFPSQNHETTSHTTNGLPFPPVPAQQQQPTYSQPTAAAPVGQDSQRRPTASNRHSLPTAQTKQSPVASPAVPMQTNNWNNSPAANAPANSPTMAQQAAKRHRPRKSVPDGVPQIQDGMQQATQNQRSPAMAARSPYQAAAATARAASRQGHRSQSNTPVSNASLSQPPTQQAAHQPVTASYSPTPTSASSSVPNYDSYARYNSTGNNQYSNPSTDHSSRIAYQPGSYHTQSAVTTSASYSATPSYDYTRTTAPIPTTPINSLSQALNVSSGGYGASGVASNQWQTSQTRSTQPQPSHYSSHSHGYNNSPEQQRATTVSSYAQNQQQSYPYTSHQQPAASQTQPSQQSWYGLGGANNNSSRNAGYGGASTTSAAPYQSHRSNVPGYASHGYASTEDQSIYDLLRASTSGN